MTGDATSFPIPILVAVSAVLAVPLVLAARATQGRAARFLIVAIWTRYIISAFHVITFDDAIAGLSFNALGSIAIAGVGMIVIEKRHLLLKALLPVYVLILLSIFSAALNAGVATSLDTVVKYIYFTVLLVAIYEALLENGPELLFRRLLVAFAPLLVFQLLSIATGIVKASELDGSRSYIGGYNHEAAFSVALATFFVCAAFATGMSRVVKALLLALILAAIVLANYRTTILALLPFVTFLAISRVSHLFIKEQRPALYATSTLVGLVVLMVLAGVASDRFADLGYFLADPGAYIKPQEEFTIEEQRLLSGRAYIWSGYIFAWLESSSMQHVFGFGPDSWSAWFKVYPHNTVLAFLFELGLAGVVVLAWWWGAMLRMAMRATGPRRFDLIFAQGSFILLNLATMALWQIEGLILYAVICGFSLYCAVQARSAGRSEWRRKPPPLGRMEGRIGGELASR